MVNAYQLVSSVVDDFPKDFGELADSPRVSCVEIFAGETPKIAVDVGAYRMKAPIDATKVLVVLKNYVPFRVIDALTQLL